MTTDRKGQSRIAEHIFNRFDCEKAVCFGTPYHTGNNERWETVFAENIGASIKDIQKIEVYGKLIKARHKIGRSSTPVGGDIMLSKKVIDDMLWEMEHDIESAILWFFGHAHYYREIARLSRRAVICPALQMWTEFGRSQSSGLIDFGVLELEVWEDWTYHIKPHCMRLKQADNSEALQW